MNKWLVIVAFVPLSLTYDTRTPTLTPDLYVEGKSSLTVQPVRFAVRTYASREEAERAALTPGTITNGAYPTQGTLIVSPEGKVYRVAWKTVTKKVMREVEEPVGSKVEWMELGREPR